MVLSGSAGVGFAGKAPFRQTEPRKPRSRAPELAKLCCLTPTCSDAPPNLKKQKKKKLFYFGFYFVFVFASVGS